jgi:hypothetical protein
MTTTMTTNLTNMKAETLMDIPVLLADNEIATFDRTTAPARKPRIGWLVPCVAVAAALVAYVAFTDLAETNASLDEVAAFMQTPQF